MDPRALPATEGKRRFGRRAGDAGLRPALYTASFVAQVAGLSMPADARPAAYADAPLPPKGLVADRKA